MDPHLSNKDQISLFIRELESCPLLNLNLNNTELIDLIPNSLGVFFDGLSVGNQFSFINYFSTDLVFNDDKIKFNNEKEVIRKNKYSNKEMLDLLGETSLLNANQITTNLLPLGQNTILDKFVDDDTIYVSFANLYYQGKDSKAISNSPLVFFKVKITKCDGQYSMVLDYNSPLYNDVLIHQIKEQYNIDLSYDYFGFNFQQFLQDQKHKVEDLSFGVDDSLCLIKCDLMKYLRLVKVIEYYQEQFMASNPVFRILEEKIEREPSKYTPKNDQPSFVQQALDTLSMYPIVRLQNDDCFSRTFLKEVISEYVLKRRNVLYVSSSKEGNKAVKQRLFSNYLDCFIPYRSISQPGSALYTMMKSCINNTTYAFDANLMMKKQELLDLDLEHRKIDKKLSKISIVTEEEPTTILENYLHWYTKAKKIYDFTNYETYDYEDYLNDQEFVRFINQSKFYLNNKIGTQPYDGINSEVNYDDYGDIVDFLLQLVKDIKKFEKAIDEADVKASNFSDFNSLKDYDNAKKIFDIFSKYDSFPLDYFKVDFSPELLNDIASLKECYRLQASMTLSIDMVCRPEIWDLDFRDILQRVNSRHEERTIRKELKDIVKITPFKRSYKTLIVLIDKYQDNEEHILQIRPRLETIFGKDALSLDGLLSIDKAYEFIQAYNRHKTLYDHYNFDNKFTKKIFNDKKFFEEYKSHLYSDMVSMRSVIEHDLDKVKTIFNEEKFDYNQSSFEEIIKRIELRLDNSRQVFDQALSFSKRLDAGSKQLRECIVNNEKNGETLANFENDFGASIYQYLMVGSLKEKNGVKLIEKNSKILNEIYSKLDSQTLLLDLDVANSFESIRSQIVSRPSFLQTLNQLKEEYHTNKFYSLERGMKIAANTLYHLYPIETTYIDRCLPFGDYRFDLVIFDVEEGIDLADFYYALNLGEKVILVDYSNKTYQNIPTLHFNLNDDLKAYPSLYSCSPEIVERVEQAFKRHQLTLQRDVKIDEQVTIPCYFEYQNQKFALKVNQNDDDLDFRDSFITPNFLYVNYGIQTEYLYLLPFIVYEDLSVISIYQNLEYLKNNRANNSEKLAKLSYEQKKRVTYFSTLDEIDKSFALFTASKETPINEKLIALRRSTLEERPLMAISVEELAGGIYAYTSRFTFLSRDTLIRRLAKIVGTNAKDVDFIQLFAKAENYLVNNDILEKKENRLSLLRK